MNKQTKYSTILRSTRYNLFSKYNSIREYLIDKKHNVKWSSVNKRKGRYLLISASLQVKIQD